MNTERILRLAERLESLPDRDHVDIGFNMGNWIRLPTAGLPPPHDLSGHHCGTTACIAGHARIMQLEEEGVAPKDIPRLVNEDPIRSTAADYLGILWTDASDLFEMANTEAHMGPVTPKQAAAVLRKLAETGVVDWSDVEREQGVGD